MTSIIQGIVTVLDLLILLASATAAVVITLAMAHRPRSPATENGIDCGMMLIYLALVLAINSLFLILMAVFFEQV